MKTIRLQLQGGLGNQLFIWAMAHELTHVYGAKIKIVYIADMLQRADRPSELTKLVMNCEHAISLGESEIMGLLFRTLDKLSSISQKISLKISNLLGIYTCHTPYEIPEFEGSPPRILRGFFQDARMVDRTSLSVAVEIEKTLQDLPPTHLIQDAMALHMRRGDTRKISKSWGVIADEYYLSIAGNSGKLIICTDDETGVENIVQKFPTAKILTPQNVTTWETLKILASAKELVMANSTLSWWAAWLSLKREGNTVYFPSPWRPNETKSFESLVIPGAIYRPADFE